MAVCFTSFGGGIIWRLDKVQLVGWSVYMLEAVNWGLLGLQTGKGISRPYFEKTSELSVPKPVYLGKIQHLDIFLRSVADI